MMWLVPIRPESSRLAEAIGEAYAGRSDGRVTHAREIASREFAAPVMGRKWSDLVSAVSMGKQAASLGGRSRKLPGIAINP
jgi:hypothetical protein